LTEEGHFMPRIFYNETRATKYETQIFVPTSTHRLVLEFSKIE